MSLSALLHAAAILMCAATVLYLASRAVLAVIGRDDTRLTSPDRWIGVRGGPNAYLWVGGLSVGRTYSGREVSCYRFRGNNGPARILSVVFGGVCWSLDLSDTVARYLLVLPWLCFALADAWWAAAAVRDADTARAGMWVGLGCINLLIVVLIFICDELRTRLYYAHQGAEGDQAEAYARGRHDGIHYAEQRQRYATGQLHTAPAYPASPYAA